MNAAGRAEAMLDDMLVERVSARGRFRRLESQVCSGREPQQRSFARANRAVTCEGAVDIAVHFKLHVAAMAASDMGRHSAFLAYVAD